MLAATAGSATGSAVTSPTWQGTETFAFPATDEGGGVYQAILEVDGAPVLARTVDDWGGRCVDTTAGARVFRYPRPCLTSVDALVAMDANALPAGDHDVALRVSDAAGNVRTVYAARKTIVAPGRDHRAGQLAGGARRGERRQRRRRGAAGGAVGADQARDADRALRRAQRDPRAAHGRRRRRGAQRPDRAGHAPSTAAPGAPLDKGGARTRGDGRFTLILPRNSSSRTLLLRYRSHANDTVAAAEKTARAQGPRGHPAVGRAATWPRGAADVTAQRAARRPAAARGRQGGRAAGAQPGRAVDHLPHDPRTARRGRFATRYTFRRGGPALYQMRVRVRAADDYPFATGASRVRPRARALSLPATVPRP